MLKVARILLRWCRRHGYFTTWASSAYVLFLRDQEIGSIDPVAWYSRRARVDLPDELPPVLKAFVVSLTMLLWKRHSDAT